jgi:hypothetical protein
LQRKLVQGPNADVACRFRRAYLRAVVQPASKQERDDGVAKFTWRSPELVTEMLPDFSTEFSLASRRANTELAIG